MDYNDINRGTSGLASDFAGAFFSGKDLGLCAVAGVAANVTTSYLTGVPLSPWSVAFHSLVVKAAFSAFDVSDKQSQREQAYWSNPDRDLFRPEEPITRSVGVSIDDKSLYMEVDERTLIDITPQN